ncbi:Aste57867_22214 [Aphanomyces stellatus]|uniref:Aste57867_22214 protein n=1 Tax=Aphanomyces stellatus TaxID=120398 RepID=A0A485LKX4_9STRA|nr:hypothetical protein As57867_022145 [Aphanomyces stellatus]VFT98881.1 Aste57867_22214 [Aphanomyces stellatus]
MLYQPCLFVVALAATIFSCVSLAFPLAGGWTQGCLTDEAITSYYTAAAVRSNYVRPNVMICVVTFVGLDQQVVSGMNYRFHVEGCYVNSVKDTRRHCTCKPNGLKRFVVQVYEQAWTNTHRVTSIEEWNGSETQYANMCEKA